MPNPTSVALLGDANIDLILDVAGLPGPGGDALAGGQLTGIGGSAANTAILLSRLGAQCSMFSCIGSDHWARLVLEELHHEGIDTCGVVQDPHEPTSLNVVAVTPDGERTMFAYRGASSRLTPESIDAEAVTAARILHVSGYALLSRPQREATLHTVELARAAGLTVTLDVPVPAAQAARDTLRDLLPALDLLVVGRPEIAWISGRQDTDTALTTLADCGVGMVALKLGDNGAVVAAADQQVQVAAFNVHAVDTTGAGDAFAAGAITALLHGSPPAAIGALANACGAAAVERPGAGRNLPQCHDIVDLIQRERHAPHPRIDPATLGQVEALLGR